jgi:hypothetical protein
MNYVSKRFTYQNVSFFQHAWKEGTKAKLRKEGTQKQKEKAAHLPGQANEREGGRSGRVKDMLVDGMNLLVVCSHQTRLQEWVLVYVPERSARTGLCRQDRFVD